MSFLDKELERRASLLFDEAYNELEQLHSINQNFTGIENSGGFIDSMVSLKDALVTFGKMTLAFGKAITPFIMSIGRRANLAAKGASRIHLIWSQNIEDDMDKIPADEFASTTVKLVTKEMLDKRIETAKKIHMALVEIKSICESKVDFDSDVVWAVSDIYELQKDVNDLGISLSKFSLTGKPDVPYNKMVRKDTLGKLGYSLSDLEGLIETTSELSGYTDKKEAEKISNDLTSYYEDLVKQERALRRSDTIPDDAKRKKIIELEVKMIRLWNLFNFLKIMYQLVPDIFKSIYTLCKVAHSKIDRKKEEF